MNGTLFLVSVPIGNLGDITLRAMDTLRESTIILCEDLKPARRLLHDLKIENELLPLNEHTEKAATNEALLLLRDGKNLALISDAGTPLVSDPGGELVRRAIEQGIRVTAVPGPSSVLAALTVSGFDTRQFYFAGMLPRDKDARKREVKSLAPRHETIVLLEAPYRLLQLLDDLVHGFGENRRACLALKLTTNEERVHRGTLLALRDLFRDRPGPGSASGSRPFKGEFAVVLEGARKTVAPKQKTTQGGFRVPRRRRS